MASVVPTAADRQGLGTIFVRRNACKAVFRLAVEDRGRQIKELMRYRRPFYERAADITIDTTYLEVDQVAEKVLEELKKHEDFAG